MSIVEYCCCFFHKVLFAFAGLVENLKVYVKLLLSLGRRK